MISFLNFEELLLHLIKKLVIDHIFLRLLLKQVAELLIFHYLVEALVVIQPQGIELLMKILMDPFN
jgi:hypothetical protein